MDFMDSIPFEKTTIEDAKAVFDLGAGKRVEVEAAPEVDWVAKRKPAGVGDRTLLASSIEWLDKLPDHVRPTMLPAQFPHIVNKMAQLWNRITFWDEYMAELLIVQRGTRKGFPLKALTELDALKTYKEQEILKSHIKRPVPTGG